MTATARIAIPDEKIAEFCRRYHICRFSLFGSVLRDDFRKDSDVDVLVEFEEGKEPGLIGLAGMELELSAVLNDHKVEINTPLFLSSYFRNKVLAIAELIYERS